MANKTAKKKRTSFAVMFITVVLILIASVVVTFMLVFYANLRSITHRQIETIVNERVTHLRDSIVNTLKEQENILYNASYGISALFDNGQITQPEMINYFSPITKLAPDIQMLYFSNNNIWYEPNGFWASFPDWTPAEGWDNTGRPWFKGAKNSPGKVAYSEPFVDAFSGEIIISLSTEVYDKNKNSIGVVAADVLVTKLNTLLNTSMIIAEQKLYLINKDGFFVTHHDVEEIMTKNFFDESNLHQYQSEVLSSAAFFKMDDEVFLYSARIPAAGWTLVSMIPVSVIYAETNSLILRLVFLSLVILAGVAVISVLFTYRLIKNQNKKLQVLIEEAEAANRTKSSFLASMSHEIRTPMNAITGMAELLLRRDLSDDARGEVYDIKQAATNLISIINDILDFSKIEAGMMEIMPVKYMLSSLVNDTVNIIRMRLKEKRIRFYTNIDGNIPNNLIGDEVRLRQILLNLLSNAVKYTDRGHISLSIKMLKCENGHVWMEVTVADSGKGIKLEDQEKLFGSFVQVDSEKNRGIEGTGLGLAITRQLCLAMNGDISFKSEYGKGSEFKVIIPQGFSSNEAFAKVEDTANKKVLVYEGRTIYAQSVCWSLENMGVP
jgi:signal transduction histidine kinase